MNDYLEIDWNQERPDAPTIDSGWSKSHIANMYALDSRFEAVLKSLQYTHANGGARLAQFKLDADPALKWFTVRDRLPEAGFFQKFFTLDLVQRRMDIPPPTATLGNLGFELANPFVAMGRLAAMISQGGAYLKFDGSDATVLQLVNGFTEAAFGNRYREVTAYLSWTAWCPWFKAIAWDATFFWLDRRIGVATVLLVTDTD